MTRPNILILMVDQLAGTFFPDGPAPWLHTPNLDRLAERSARFANTYTASPLCAPGRGGFMSSMLPSATGIYDNAAEFRADIPTFAHHLRRAGYATCLTGKMHFVGPDQMHGFEERMTTDIYPADFGWTPDYRKPGERIDWWYHNMGSVTGAGIAEITNQMEYDDEVAHLAGQKLYDLSRRGQDVRPWCLTVSFTHPHDPYVARRRFWDLYEGCEHLAPDVSAMAYEDHDPHSKRIFDANDWRSYSISDDHIADARRAYFSNISYLDEKIGKLMQILDDSQQEAVVIFVSDHGDMLGERGLWFKMSMFEGSARVPLMIAAPGVKPGRIDTPVSTLDVGPTLADLAGIDLSDIAEWTHGTSLLPIADGASRVPVPIEYAAEASIAPIVTLRDARYKFVRCKTDPDQLYDLQQDPLEQTNLATDPAHAKVLARLSSATDKQWKLDQFDADVRASQARRLVVYDALRQGGYYPWDFQPLQKASERFMRNHMDLNILEDSQRFPRGE